MSTFQNVKQLICSWNGCSYIHTNVKSEKYGFLKHVTSHIPQIEIVNDHNGEEMYSCSWLNCSFQCKCSQEIVMHVKYHAYHTRLKAIGSHLAVSKELPECSFEPIKLPVQNELYKCKWRKCKETFNCQETFIKHVYEVHTKRVTSNSEDRYLCLWEDCAFDVAKRAKLDYHARIHTGEKAVACPNCGKMFVDSSKYSSHCFRQLSTEDSRFQCTHCFRWFATARLLKDHMRIHVQHYKCTMCELTCRSPSTLSTHIRYRHIDFKPFKCHLCSYSCKKQYDLRSHMITHSEEYLFCESDDCHFSTKRQENLKKHIEKCHGSGSEKGYSCHLCKKKFSAGNRLTKHLCDIHNVQKPHGFSRFMYRLEEDGYRRLQTTRLESIEISDEQEQSAPATRKSKRLNYEDSDVESVEPEEISSDEDM